MTVIIQRLRPLLVGIVALLLTAGIAFASKPPAVPTSSVVAPVPAVPETVAGEDGGTDTATTSETTPVEATTEETDETEETSDGDSCSVDPTALDEDQLAGLNHGSIVCGAAHQEAPEGYRNHGAWVSEWAKKNHGHPPAPESEPTTSTDPAAGTTTTTTSTVTTDAPADHPGKGKAKGHGRDN